jgi:hypothetical protein
MGSRKASEVEAIGTLLDAGRTLEAFDRLRTVRAAGHVSLGLACLEARALERLGAADEAVTLLENLGRRALDDGEAAGLLAALSKRRALTVGNEVERRRGLEKALDRYADGWARLGGSWFGINVATLEYALGRRDEAAATAGAVLRVLEEEGAEAGRGERDEVWAMAVRGEAALLSQRVDEAMGAYGAFRDHAVPRRLWDTMAGAKRNARLILDTAPASSPLLHAPQSLLDLLTPPPVVMAVGHLVDALDREVPRLPEALVPSVRRAIAAALDREGVSVGISSLAAGTDLLFQGELVRRGASRHVVLPFDSAAFLQASVHGRGHLPWAQTFHDLRERADRAVLAARQPFEQDAFAFRYANEVVLGLALLEADRLGTEVVGVAVWDGRSADGPGGTQGVVRLWRDQDALRRIVVIHPQDLDGWPHECAPSPPEEDPAYPWPEGDGVFEVGESALAGILFADAKGFSKLDEAATRRFADDVLAVVSEVARPYSESVYLTNTWGDGLLYVFRDLESAARCAIDLAREMRARGPQFRSWGFPEEFGFRIGLHAGPVRILRDPVLDRPRVFGAHLDFASRIEPVATANHVFASEAFTALARARGLQGLRFRYVGERPLGGERGTAALYHLE